MLAVGIEYLIWGRGIAGYIYAKANGILLGLTWMVVFFYTYTGILGAHSLWLDIVSFLVAVAIPVSYTHLDVYKRQEQAKAELCIHPGGRKQNVG